MGRNGDERSASGLCTAIDLRKDSFLGGFTNEFAGLRNGIVHLGSEPERLGMYRFWDPEPIRFENSLDILLTWKYESRGSDFRKKLEELGHQDRLWVDYATTTYWYQARPGYEHRPLPAFEDRITPLLRPKPGTVR